MIEIIFLDVDGCLSDGGIYKTTSGDEFKRFDVKDGFAIQQWNRMGKISAIITGKSSQIVADRAKELEIKDQGVSDYSIFWDKDTNLLFAVQKCDKDTNSQDTSNVDPITQRWWDMMADIMEVNPDNSPISVPLQELFHLD